MHALRSEKDFCVGCSFYPCPRLLRDPQSRNNSFGRCANWRPRTTSGSRKCCNCWITLKVLWATIKWGASWMTSQTFFRWLHAWQGSSIASMSDGGDQGWKIKKSFDKERSEEKNSIAQLYITGLSNRQVGKLVRQQLAEQLMIEASCLGRAEWGARGTPYTNGWCGHFRSVKFLNQKLDSASC